MPLHSSSKYFPIKENYRTKGKVIVKYSYYIIFPQMVRVHACCLTAHTSYDKMYFIASFRFPVLQNIVFIINFMDL